jgi:hypothetical protein
VRWFRKAEAVGIMPQWGLYLAVLPGMGSLLQSCIGPVILVGGIGRSALRCPVGPGMCRRAPVGQQRCVR